MKRIIISNNGADIPYISAYISINHVIAPSEKISMALTFKRFAKDNGQYISLRDNVLVIEETLPIKSIKTKDDTIYVELGAKQIIFPKTMSNN